MPLLIFYSKGVSFLQYLKSLIARSADSYLDELQNQLEDMCHVKVSVSTIWKALRREGFTMKRVRQCYMYFIIIQGSNTGVLDYKDSYRAKRNSTT